MKKWFSGAVLLGVMLVFGGSSIYAAGTLISGVISNWEEVKAKVPAKAYLQLVKADGKVRFTTDGEGLATYESEFPKVSVRKDGSFQVNNKNLPPGKYVIALQGGVNTIYSSPLLIKEGKILKINVPGNVFNVGKVYFDIK